MLRDESGGGPECCLDGIGHVGGAKLNQALCTQRENLAGDAKGAVTSGDHREAESTDAPERGGLPRSSDEGPVIELVRRGRVTAGEHGPTG